VLPCELLVILPGGGCLQLTCVLSCCRWRAGHMGLGSPAAAQFHVLCDRPAGWWDAMPWGSGVFHIDVCVPPAAAAACTSSQHLVLLLVQPNMMVQQAFLVCLVKPYHVIDRASHSWRGTAEVMGFAIRCCSWVASQASCSTRCAAAGSVDCILQMGGGVVAPCSFKR
jgi:hypothetical protein